MIRNLKKQTIAVGVVGQKILIYGDNETGKTTVALELGKKICKMVSKNPEAVPLVISMENGTNAQGDFYPIDGSDFKNVKETLDDLNNPINKKYILDNMPVIIVDGAEKIPTIAKKFVTSKKNIEVLGDLSYGKGFDIYKSYTDAPFIKLMNSEFTVIFLFHNETDKETGYTFPSGSEKETSICKFIRDNSDFWFYLQQLPDENGLLQYSTAFCDKTLEHFGRNRYGEGTDAFEIPFNADEVIKYIDDCGNKLAKKRGMSTVTVVEKKSDNEVSKEELIDKVNNLGKQLYATAYKERAKEIIGEYMENAHVKKIGDIEDINILTYMYDDLHSLASEKGIEC